MRKLVLDQRERVAEWVASQGAFTMDGGFYEAIGLEEDGEIIAGAVVNDYVKNARCAIHCAGTGGRWLSRGGLFLAFDYIFRQLNCNVVVATINDSNTSSKKLASHLGFEEKCRIEGGAPDGDLVIFSLHRDNCRWDKPRRPRDSEAKE